MQARGDIKPAGVHTPDEAVPADKYIAALKKRGIRIREIAGGVQPARKAAKARNSRKQKRRG
jgi:hypothetical protein